MDKNTKLECAKKKCKAKFKYGDMKEVPDRESFIEHGLAITKHVCPECGHNEFYELN